MMDPEKSRLLEELVEVQKRHTAVVGWHGILQNGDYEEVTKTLMAIIGVGDTAHWARATHLPKMTVNQSNTAISKTKRKTPVSTIREKLRTWRRRVDSSLTLVYDDLHLVDRRLATEKGPPRSRPVARLEMLTLAAKMAIAPSERDAGWRRRGVGIGPSGIATRPGESQLQSHSQLPPQWPEKQDAKRLQQQPDMCTTQAAETEYLGSGDVLDAENPAPILVTQTDGEITGDLSPIKIKMFQSNVKRRVGHLALKEGSSDEQSWWGGEEDVTKLNSNEEMKYENTRPPSDEKQEPPVKEKGKTSSFTHDAINDLLSTSVSGCSALQVPFEYHGAETWKSSTLRTSTQCSRTNRHEGATTAVTRSSYFKELLHDAVNAVKTSSAKDINEPSLMTSGSGNEGDIDDDNYGGDTEFDSDAPANDEDDDDDDDCIQRGARLKDGIITDENNDLDSRETSRDQVEQDQIALSWADDTVLTLTGLCDSWCSRLRITWQLATVAVASYFHS